MKIRNPFFRPVPLRYWQAEAYVRKPMGAYTDSLFIHFNAPSPGGAQAGLIKLIREQGYTDPYFLPPTMKQDDYPIPVWSPAFWIPALRPRFMRKRGFFLTTINETYYS